MDSKNTAKSYKPEEYFVENEPYYEPVADEIEVFEIIDWIFWFFHFFE